MSYKFLSFSEYLSELMHYLEHAQAGDKFMTVTMMAVATQPRIAGLFDAMIAAARRGVEVSFVMDANSFLMSADRRRPGPLLFRRHLPRHGMGREFQVMREYLDRLDQAGVRTAILNRPNRPLTSPVHGRSHIKFTVMGDRYYLGSANLFDGTIELVVTDHNPRVAHYLAALGDRMLSTGSARAAIDNDDVSYIVDSTAELYIDAGIKHQSIILRQALDFIDAAQKHITLVCQFFPSGITAQRLQAAHDRGVKVDIIFNRPSPSDPIAAADFAAGQFERLRRPKSFFDHPHRGAYLHAKLLATEQGAIIGSHNFVIQGVNFATAEIALKVLDSDFSRQAVLSVTHQLARKSV